MENTLSPFGALIKRKFLQQFYAECLEHFGYDAQQSRRKAQAVFALIHGSLISSWIKQDATDLQLARESLKEILDR